MGVLKQVAGKDSVNFVVKITKDLHGRISELKATCKEHGFAVDFNQAAVQGIERLLERASNELKGLGGSKQQVVKEKTG